MTTKERIVVISRTREIGESIKIIIKINIGINHEISMIVIILIVEIGHMTETDHTIEIGHILETGTTHKNTKETGHTLEIDHMTEMIHIVEIDHETITKVTIKKTTEMIIEMKIIEIRDKREGLEIIMKMLMKTCTVGINIDTNT